MRRAEAVEIVMRAVRDELVVACNGMITREVFTFRDREANFYMIGSMGLALSIGMGVALSRPERTVLVLDGDGNLLMGAGVLASVAAAGLRNLRIYDGRQSFRNFTGWSAAGYRMVSATS